MVPADAAASVQTIANQVTATGGAAIGTLSMHVTVDGPLETATLDPATVSLPSGTYDLNACLGSVPASASVATPCAATTVTLAGAGTAASRAVSLVIYRPMSSATAVSVTGVLNVRRHSGSTTTLFATSYASQSRSSLSVAPLSDSPVVPQDRGSNVHLFKAGATLEGLAQELDAVKAAGGTIVRTALPWVLLQPQNTPSFDADAVAKVDGFLQLAQQRGIKVLAIFGSTPCWTSSAPASVRAGCASSLGDWDRYPTSSAATLQAAAKELGTRWGGELAGVEFWNEPNNGQFFAAGAAAYVGLLKIFYPALKSVAPNLPVVAGTLSLADTTFLQAMYKAGARGYYDAISVHPYEVTLGSSQATSDPALAWPGASTTSTFATGVEAVHSVMTANGDATVPLWITEFGFSTCTGGSRLCVTQAQQAQYLAETFKMAARWSYVPVVLSYLVRDQAADGSWTGSFGMQDTAYGEKASYDAVTSAWSCLAAGTC